MSDRPGALPPGRGGGFVELWVAVAVMLASLGVWLAFGLAGWPGEPNHCVAVDTCFCEAFRDGMVKQPANTFSNFGFILAGLLIGAIPGWERTNLRRPAASNRMTAGGFYPAVYAGVVVFLGPGSMFLHASFVDWGGKVDVISMYLFIAFGVAYNGTRILRLSQAGFLSAFVGLAVALSLHKWIVNDYSDPIFGAGVGAIILSEVWIYFRRPDLRVDRRPLFLAAGAFALAFAIWVPSQTGGPLCTDRHSLLQGHAAWHLLSAVTCLSLYAYFRSEAEPTANASA